MNVVQHGFVWFCPMDYKYVLQLKGTCLLLSLVGGVITFCLRDHKGFKC